jgi:NADH:ubiquinone oxidoreductase subunit E
MDEIIEHALTEKEKSRVRKIIKERGDKGETIALLLSLQRELGFLSRETLEILSQEGGIPLSHLFGVATFYSQFSLKPRGKHVIRVCQGTACHVQGADEVAEAVKDELGIEEGETTKDRLFTLEFVNCLGCCSLAPVMVVNEVGVHAKMGAEKARRIIRKLRREGK